MSESDRTCAEDALRDALPDLLHGRLVGAPRARVEAHVRTCERCAGELALLRRVSAEAMRAAPSVDLDAIATAVVARTLGAPASQMEPVAERPALSSPVPRLAAPGRRARERARRRWGLDAALAIRPTIRAAAAVVLVALGAGAIVLGRGGGGDTRGAAAVAVGRGVPKAPGTEGRVAVVDSPAAIRERPAGGHALGATFADLSDEELDAVLAALDESAAALVALEPAPVPPVLPEGT